MTRHCERPGCAARASVAYGFDAGRRMAWFAEMTSTPDAAALAGALCAAHARAMVLPRGWWLDDRREDGSGTLFGAPGGGDDRAERAAGHQPATVHPQPARRRTRRARTTVAWVGDRLPLDAETATAPAAAAGPAAPLAEAPVSIVAAGSGDADGPSDPEHVGDREPGAPADEPAAEDDADRVVVPWRPRFDQTDDLDGVLAARSPLLARAFGGLRRSAPRPTRDE